MLHCTVDTLFKALKEQMFDGTTASEHTRTAGLFAILSGHKFVRCLCCLKTNGRTLSGWEGGSDEWSVGRERVES